MGICVGVVICKVGSNSGVNSQLNASLNSTIGNEGSASRVACRNTWCGNAWFERGWGGGGGWGSEFTVRNLIYIVGLCAIYLIRHLCWLHLDLRVTPCWRVLRRTKQLSTVAILLCRFLSCWSLAKSTFLRSINPAMFVRILRMVWP